jgi:hypothetical protein
MIYRRPLPPPRIGVWLLGATLLPGCGLLFPDPGPAAPARGGQDAEDGVHVEALAPNEGIGEGSVLPLGLGTLRQEEISVDLRRGEMQIRLTPLTESVTRTAAPDTWERLSSLAQSHRELLRRESGVDPQVQLFLVAFYSGSFTLPFEPGALTLVSRGVRHRPLDIRPISPSWTAQRLVPREPQLALYAFPVEVDVEGDLAVEYMETRSQDWERVLPRIQTERARIRARAPRGGSGFGAQAPFRLPVQASIPNF